MLLLLEGKAVVGVVIHKQQYMNDKPTPTPMTAEEFISNNYSYSKEPLAWRLFKGSVASLMNDYANYRLAFEKEQHQPSDPYWSDPATWPEWANWRAVGEDGCVYFSSILMEANTLYGSWSTSIYAASKMVPRAVTHNPNWRNSLRSREEVSRGK
jgi:hypothetical protein